MTLGTRDLEHREQLRRGLRQRPNCRFVDLEEFEDLLVSPRQLERYDDPSACLRGVRDPQTGLCFMIEMEKIARARFEESLEPIHSLESAHERN